MDDNICEVYSNTHTNESHIKVGGVKLHGIAGILVDTVAVIYLLDGNSFIIRPTGHREFKQNSALTKQQMEIMFQAAVTAIGGRG
jgi:hypothetical protein